MFLIGYTDGENQDIHYIFTCAREKEAGRKKGGKEEEEGEGWEREEERQRKEGEKTSPKRREEKRFYEKGKDFPPRSISENLKAFVTKRKKRRQI